MSSTAPINGTKAHHAVNHPLDPLTPEEITAVSLVVRKYIASQTPIKAIKFITCYLLPPPKKAVLAFLGIPLTPGGKLETPTEIVRKAEVDFLDVVNGYAYNSILSFKDAKWFVDTLDKLAEGIQPQISVEELIACEMVVKKDERIRKLAKDVGVLPEQIHADGWAIGYDDRFPQGRRIQQALLFARFSEHDNLYAHPLDFIPVIDSNSEEVLHIDFPPVYKTSPKGVPELSVPSTEPLPLSDDSLSESKRDRIPPPRKAFEFLPDLMAKTGDNFKPREDVKPLHVVQPEGVSFTMNGHELEWQKWKMHIAFSQREGVAISTITYNDNGEVRPIFYRLSLVEMVVPYAAPEFPHPRKFAFDVGEYGMGTMANELSLGCDCLGQIHYLPGSFVGHSGSPMTLKNVICIHEEDAGVLWKHTDYRYGGRSHTVRSRRLVVSMVCTLANYEYIWNYYFYQDGSIQLEIRLTGILQVYVSGDNEPTPFGTNVAPNVNAHYHQHIFSVRVDPMVDGLSNSVVETDIVPFAHATGTTENFAGNAFVTKETMLKDQSDGAREYDFDKERRWRIVNPARKHYCSGDDVGYVLVTKNAALPTMARDDGWAATRAAFVKKAMWVVKDIEDSKGGRMWPSGKYVPQTRSDPTDSVGSWVKEKGNIENDDILLFITIGTTHIPRPEDWPVMPVEHLNLTFKPQSFFATNPSIDVPGSKDSKSVMAFPEEVKANGTSESCCSN